MGWLCKPFSDSSDQTLFTTTTCQIDLYRIERFNTNRAKLNLTAVCHEGDGIGAWLQRTTFGIG